MDADTFVIFAAWPLNVMATFCDVLDDPNSTLKFSGFGVATRPFVVPDPMFRLTVKFNDPDDVLTVTVPE